MALAPARLAAAWLNPDVTGAGATVGALVGAGGALVGAVSAVACGVAVCRVVTEDEGSVIVSGPLQLSAMRQQVATTANAHAIPFRIPVGMAAA
jgi:hypothetical protein